MFYIVSVFKITADTSDYVISDSWRHDTKKIGFPLIIRKILEFLQIKNVIIVFCSACSFQDRG